EEIARRPVEVFEEAPLPGVPDLGAGAADVGDGEQVEGGKVTLAAYAPGERPDHFGIGDVLLLRRRGHHEVVFDQPRDKARILGCKTVLAAEAQGVHGAELGVVAPEPLGDIVEQRCEIEHLGAREIAHQAAADGKLVRELRYREAPQVAYYAQDVLVDG